ncbi:FAD-dependent monooxygenase [Baia soyae]|uniref:2-polyprenyl-6-methoxyphenol hydroxylase-like FAD-dependent oxidoreductase n=1 Tax=Baia soyae TaxID=1544746 RepID=A0A4R2S128_9BACL|nr:FAD-dependent monooxygenase [Baia soyae]TCP69879.1 2-polyprenyl-6-methoxyphenol hydroxylase-like FAD-dependent oxidoreductase [Baia soyae]
MRKKVIIIGGGIAGLSAAIALQKLGFDVNIYEEYPERKPAGAGIVLASNALKGLDHLGIYQQVKNHGRSIHGLTLLSEKGKHLSKQTIPSPFEQISIHRADLHLLLSSAVQPDTVYMGKKCIHFEQDETGVTVFFQDHSKATGDFLLATDGIHSVIRKNLLPSTQLRYAGYTCWRGVITQSNVNCIPEDATETWGIKGRFGIVPLPNQQIYWYALINAPYQSAQYSAYQAKDLFEHFKDYHDPIPSILNGNANNKMIHNDIIDIPSLQRFAFHRILLMGDAAHAITPNLGQGACQAIEDAVVLAHCLKNNPSVHKAFSEFEAKRLKRTETISRYSRLVGKMAQVDNPFLSLLRNTLLKRIPKSVNRKQLEYLYKVDFNSHLGNITNNIEKTQGDRS